MECFSAVAERNLWTKEKKHSGTQRLIPTKKSEKKLATPQESIIHV